MVRAPLHGASRPGRAARGFTLIGPIVLLALPCMLGPRAPPRYLHRVERSREAVLRHDLRSLRDAIDKFFADQGRYPASLDELAQRRYLRSVPVDPLTDSAASWVIVAPSDGTGVYDVHSGAP